MQNPSNEARQERNRGRDAIHEYITVEQPRCLVCITGNRRRLCCLNRIGCLPRESGFCKAIRLEVGSCGGNADADSRAHCTSAADPGSKALSEQSAVNNQSHRFSSEHLDSATKRRNGNCWARGVEACIDRERVQHLGRVILA